MKSGASTDTAELKESIRKLMNELDFAYQGIRLLPKDHPARYAYYAAMELLNKP